MGERERKQKKGRRETPLATEKFPSRERGALEREEREGKERGIISEKERKKREKEGDFSSRLSSRRNFCRERESEGKKEKWRKRERMKREEM